MNLIHKKSRILILTICLLTILFSPQIAVGQETESIEKIKESLNVTLGIDDASEEITEITGNTDLTISLGRAMNSFFAILGVIFFIVVVFGGLRWMTAGGNEEKLATGKKFVVGGVEGMIVIFLSYAFIYLILTALGAATSNT